MCHQCKHHDSCSSPGGLGDTTDAAISDGLMAGSSVGGSCEYHQVLETDLLLKCAQELDPSVVADVTTCMLQYQELDPNVVAGL